MSDEGLEDYDKQNDEDEQTPSARRLWAILGAILIVGTVIVYWLWRYYYWVVVKYRAAQIASQDTGVKEAWSHVGSMGDSFGAFSALFTGIGVIVSAVAFFGFLYALKMQRDDLNLQRGEMKRTRRVMRQQAKISREQLLMATKQMLSSALPSHVELMQKALEKTGITQADISAQNNYFFQNVLSQIDGLLEEEVPDCMFGSEGVLMTLGTTVQLLERLEPWRNAIYMWEEKVQALNLPQEEVCEYSQNLLRSCTKDERKILLLGRIRDGKISCRMIPVLEELRTLFRITEKEEGVSSVLLARMVGDILCIPQLSDIRGISDTSYLVLDSCTKEIRKKVINVQKEAQLLCRCKAKEECP